jgi:hypothetical protein
MTHASPNGFSADSSSGEMARLTSASCGTSTRAEALALLAPTLAAVGAETTARVCDLVCAMLLALLEDTAVEKLNGVIASLNAREYALFTLVSTAALGVCPTCAVEDLDISRWDEHVVREAVCYVTTARLASQTTAPDKIQPTVAL